MHPHELVESLKNIYHNELESVILYGSAADGEFVKGYSDYNTLIVLKELSPIELARSTKIIRKWVSSGNPTPLFFTTQDIANALDVFPIEFLDIRQRHRVLFGTDPFANADIASKNLRHQCEHELRSKLLILQQRFSLLADKPKEVIKLILESSSSFFAIFGGVIRLTGALPSHTKKELAEQLSHIINPSILIEILNVREGVVAWRNDEAFEKFEQYLTSIEAVIRFVDKL